MRLALGGLCGTLLVAGGLCGPLLALGGLCGTMLVAGGLSSSPPGASTVAALSETATVRGSTAPAVRASSAPAGTDTIRFRHEDHVELDCVACHATGRPTDRTEQTWCAECHHAGVAFARCGDCHPAGDLARPYAVRQTLRMAAGGVQARALPFSHRQHTSVGCGDCHRTGAMPRADLPCVSCHDSHHRPDAACTACHREPPPSAHNLEVHLEGCGGAGCHGEAAAHLEAMGRTPSVCLSCHQAQLDHERGQLCTGCHVLPRRAIGPRDAAAGGGSGGR